MVRFPKDPAKREQWRRLVAKSHQNPHWEPKSYSRICEAHFLQNQWKSPRSTLKSDAFPINFCMCAVFVSEPKGPCHPACVLEPTIKAASELQNLVGRKHQSQPPIQHRASCPIFYEIAPMKPKGKKMDNTTAPRVYMCAVPSFSPDATASENSSQDPSQLPTLEWNSVMSKINELEKRARNLHIQSKQSLFAQVESLQAQDESDAASDIFDRVDHSAEENEKIIQFLKEHPIQTSQALLALLEETEPADEQYVSIEGLEQTLEVFKTEELTKAADKIDALEVRILELEKTIQSLQEQVLIE